MWTVTLIGAEGSVIERDIHCVPRDMALVRAGEAWGMMNGVEDSAERIIINWKGADDPISARKENYGL